MILRRIASPPLLLRSTLVFVGAFLYFFSLQFATDSIIEYDGHFHIKYAYLMRTERLIPNRSWLTETILSGRFPDHHFLYHLLLVPFTYLDLAYAGKVAPVAFSALMMVVLLLVLRARGVPWPGFWLLVVLGSSHPFLYRMNMCRVQNVSLAFLLLAFHWLSERRSRRMAGLTFAYVWLYLSASVFMPVLALLNCWSHKLVRQRPPWRLVLVCLAAWAAGYVINPFFPDTVRFGVIDMLHKLPKDYSVPVGNEWYGYSSDFLLSSSWLTFVAMFVGILLWFVTSSRARADTAFAFLVSCMFFVGALKARRFVEYWPVFSVVFCALACRDWLSVQMEDERWRSRVPAWWHGVQGAAMAMTLVFAVISYRAARDDLSEQRRTFRYARAAQWLADHTTDGEVVFNADWDEFPEFFFYNSKNSFVVGLDPAYMDEANHQKYVLWNEITDGNVDRPARTIRRVFHARYAFLTRSDEDLMRKLEEDPDAVQVFADSYCVVYELRETDTSSTSQPR